jgi:hypothetical protein
MSLSRSTEHALHDELHRQQRRNRKRDRQGRTARRDTAMSLGCSRESRHLSFNTDQDPRYADTAPPFALPNKPYDYSRPPYYGDYSEAHLSDSYSDCNSIDFCPSTAGRGAHNTSPYFDRGPRNRSSRSIVGNRRREADVRRHHPLSDGRVDSSRTLPPFTKASSGQTVLHLASCFGHATVLQLLLSTQVRPAIHLRDDHGRTALHLAAANGHIEAVEMLLQTTATPGAPTITSVLNARDN